MDPREALINNAKADTVEVWLVPDIADPLENNTLLPVASLDLPKELAMFALRSAATGQSVLGHGYAGNSFDFQMVVNGMTDAQRRMFNNLGAAGSTTFGPRVGAMVSSHVLRIHDPAIEADDISEDLFLLRVQFKGASQNRAGGAEQAQWTVRATACTDPVTGNSYRLGEVVTP